MSSSPNLDILCQNSEEQKESLRVQLAKQVFLEQSGNLDTFDRFSIFEEKINSKEEAFHESVPNAIYKVFAKNFLDLKLLQIPESDVMEQFKNMTNMFSNKEDAVNTPNSDIVSEDGDNFVSRTQNKVEIGQNTRGASGRANREETNSPLVFIDSPEVVASSQKHAMTPKPDLGMTSGKFEPFSTRANSQNPTNWGFSSEFKKPGDNFNRNGMGPFDSGRNSESNRVIQNGSNLKGEETRDQEDAWSMKAQSQSAVSSVYGGLGPISPFPGLPPSRNRAVTTIIPKHETNFEHSATLMNKRPGLSALESYGYNGNIPAGGTTSAWSLGAVKRHVEMASREIDGIVSIKEEEAENLFKMLEDLKMKAKAKVANSQKGGSEFGFSSAIHHEDFHHKGPEKMDFDFKKPRQLPGSERNIRKAKTGIFGNGETHNCYPGTPVMLNHHFQSGYKAKPAFQNF